MKKTHHTRRNASNRLELSTTTIRTLQQPRELEIRELEQVVGGYASLSRGDDTRCSDRRLKRNIRAL